uniref:AP-4 complex subunit epsilon-1 C-terminal domain-containing protein n=1 Tax=Chaetoceros debilis TaxID=122233 RepID=A0A7S3VAQ8_9STRA
MSGMHLSKEFFELLKAVGESKSKQEEDRIIQREISTLKKKLESKKAKTIGGGHNGAPTNSLNANRKKAKEFLVRLLYVEMLGHDGSFGYIKAVELAASSSIIHKRTGYLLCACTLAPSHEFRFMLVNQMQRDMQSSSILEISASLIATTNLITADMVPAMQGLVVKMLDHASEIVRKKAIIAMHRFHQLAPEAVEKQDVIDKLRKVLCDRDPSVMGASLNVIESMASVDAKPFKDLVPSLISILKQVIEHRLPSDFEYHRVPAPWIQMKLVRILAVLGKNDANASNGMYEIIGECMKKADVGINAGYAVVYECVRTITAIYPNSTLLDAAADAISRFIQSKSQNLKYFGVTGLASIVESHPQYAEAHQMSVIECLEDRDETLQRRTLDLLYKMTNPVNVTFIAEKLLHFLKGTTDSFLKEDLTKKVCNLAERYAPNNLWYVETMSELFEISGDFVSQEVAQNLMTLIAEGAGEDEGEDADESLRQHCVIIYANMLSKPISKLPKLLIETMAWVLGEYAYLSADYSLEEILNSLCAMVKKGKHLQQSTRKIIVSAIMKLVAQAGTCPPQAAKIIDNFTKSKDVDLQQRCIEFQNVITSAPHILGEILPVDASCEDVQVDPNLSFMDFFVGQAVADGAKPYEKPEDDDDDDDYAMTSTSKASAFKLTPYEKPSKPGSSYNSNMMGASGSSSNAGHMDGGGAGTTLPPGTYGHSQSGGSSGNPSAGNDVQLNVRNVANKWGKGGLTSGGSSNVPPPPPAAPSAPAPGGNTWSTPSPYQAQSTSTPATSQPSAAPIKTEEQIRKERMAAALFGGGGSAVPSRSVPKRTIPKAPVSHALVAPSAPVPPPAPAPAPVPAAPEVDLLDFMNEPAAPASSVGFDVDVLAPTSSIQAAPEAAPAPAAPIDPFADSGLLDGLSDAPLDSLQSSNTFLHNGQALAPMAISTPEFGEKWGSSCPHASPISVTSSKFPTLLAFMDGLCKSIGLHTIESIPATSEGICAGMVGGTELVLIHAKVAPVGAEARIDCTIKSTDAALSGCLAMYMQNLMR